MAVHRHSRQPRPGGVFVLDTRELGRRPGTMRPVQHTVSAPERIGLDLVAVPAGAPLELDLRMESVVEGVLVSGTVTAQAVGECSRCLQPLQQPVQVYLTELYAYPDSATEQTTEADEVRRIVDDRIDLTEAITDALVLELPLQPLCTDDCPGMCSECGVRLADAEPGHRHETMDPRWAALAAKFGTLSPEPGASAEAEPTHVPPTHVEEK